MLDSLKSHETSTIQADDGSTTENLCFHNKILTVFDAIDYDEKCMYCNLYLLFDVGCSVVDLIV